MEIIKGIPVSAGYAIGRIFMTKKEEPSIKMTKINPETYPQEISKLHHAIKIAKEQIEKILEQAQEKLGKDKSFIFAAHLDILSDPVLLENITNKVKREHKNVAWALNDAIREFCDQFEAIDDEYLKERVADIKDVGRRVLKNLQGGRTVDLSNINKPTLLASYDLLPSDTASLNTDYVLGFVTQVGGKTSHTSIIARSLKIPAVVGVSELSEKLSENDLAVIDGVEGIVYINPTDAILTQYKAKKKEYELERDTLTKSKYHTAKTTDGKTVSLFANIGNEKDAKMALKCGAEGIGLYRTELLYMDNVQFPTEKEQFETYKAICECIGDKVVTIRTFDIGGDKSLPYFHFPSEDNPFLGWRAIRICFDYEHLLITQIRAILAASAFGKIRIIFPMIISVEEFRKAKECVENCKKSLRLDGIPFDENIELGIMVETPASVLLADQFAKEVDFFSIGTNDLTQYILAVDRGNEKIAHLYNSFHPAVLAAIKRVIDASHAAGKRTSMCGELAGDTNATLLLLGMGLDEFSMSAVSIAEIKNIIQKASYEKMRILAEDALTKATVAEVLAVIEQSKLNIN